MTGPATKAAFGLAPAEKPTIVIVQGSFQTPQAYETLRNKLKACGFPVLHPSLPSCSSVDDPEFPSITLVDDALTVRSMLIRLVEYEAKTVVVVMHSYGGLVGSEAVAEDLCYSNREAKKLRGGVVHLFYYSAFILAAGQSVIKAFRESPNNDIWPDGRFKIKNSGQVLYNDLPEADATLWESRTIPQSYNVQKTELTRCAYEYIPPTYLICENDQAAPPHCQEMFASTIKAHVERCSSGHSAQLSQPDVLVDKIKAAVEKIHFS